MALARHLKKIGAACYTAWWCPHCQEQRESFGKEAVEAWSSAANAVIRVCAIFVLYNTCELNRELFTVKYIHCLLYCTYWISLNRR